MRRLILLGFAFCVVGAAPSFADQSCHLTGSPMTAAAMKQSLVTRGYTTVRSLKFHNGCYEAFGLDKNGKRFNLELNGQTGAIRAKE
ncbi:MAG TPA: PepSY domain-containing protein [Acetobacteraceae bacterium]|nr:PepSY domain-containing protein [Acetobacteraceae bacterium]